MAKATASKKRKPYSQVGEGDDQKALAKWNEKWVKKFWKNFLKELEKKNV